MAAVMLVMAVLLFIHTYLVIQREVDLFRALCLSESLWGQSTELDHIDGLYAASIG
jgi:hypothetical protein